MTDQQLAYKEKIAKTAIQLYEHYERDYANFTNSRLRAIKYCDNKIATVSTSEDKLIWLDVKTELQNSKL